MPPLRLLSAPAQVAVHLRAELARGRWIETMPGVDRLAAELVVNRKTLEAALGQLEREGLLKGQGPRRKRLIVPRHGLAVRPMRIAMLLYERSDSQREYILKLPDALMNAGHTFIHTTRSLVELKMDVARVSRFVKRNAADAWVVMAGSRPLLEWFSVQPFPVFALFGRRQDLTLAGSGPDYRACYAAAVRHLAGLGHRRIVLLVRRERRLPDFGPPERTFISELQALGLPVSSYNTPDWEETKAGLRKVLGSLFRVTPPTALIIDEPDIFIAAEQFLAEQGLRVPQQVSLISTENHPHFNWCATDIAHYQWDQNKIVPRIIRWAKSVSLGHRDTKQTVMPAKFVPGGTISRAPVES